jgi:hypothetical protein
MVFRNNDSYVDMAKFLQNLLITRATDTGIAARDVYFGDQQNVPRTPSACIDPGGKTRTRNGDPRRTLVTLTNYIIVYHYEVKSLQDVREDADRLGETVEAIVHEDSFMGDSVLDSMVISVESGYLQRRNSMYRATRLTIEATAQTQLPSQFS